MSLVGQISEAFGFGEPKLWLVAALLLTFTVLAAVVVFVAMGLIRNRLKKGSAARDFVEVTRLPFTYLAFLASLLEYMSVIIPGSVASWFDSVDTAQSILVIATLMWVMLRYINRFERNLDKRAQRDGAVILPIVGERIERGRLQILFKSLRAFVAIIILLMVLQAFGVSITGLLAFGGVGGIVIGFAARDLISNAFIGFRIIWSKPFDVGDWIKCDGLNVEGVVESVGWQITQMRTFDKRPLYVPNSLLANAVIENPQRMTNRRFYEYFGLRYSDMKLVSTIVQDVRDMLSNNPDIAQDQIQMVNLDRFGAYSIDFFVYCMTSTTDWKQYHMVKEDLLLKIAAIVEKNGGDFAFPTRTVNFDGQEPAPFIGPQPGAAAPGL